MDIDDARNVEALIVHMYQLTGFAAIRQSDPMEAAKLWKQMSEFCDKALWAMKDTKDATPQLYLILDYKAAADRRYSENLQDCQYPGG